MKSEGRILVVDDTPSIIQALVGVLRERGYAVSVATNGRRALDLLASVSIDLVLMDVMMPESDGFETCARIKERPEWKDIPVIFLTSKANPDDIVQGFELGAVDYVAKPFHSHELLARVQTHLTMDRLRRENGRLVRAECELARHRSVSQMVAGVAHELNTPLGVINTAASLLASRVNSPALTAIAETPDGKALMEDLVDASNLITRNTARAHKLVQDFKKVSVHQITDRLEMVKLTEVVDETSNLFHVTARPFQMELVMDSTLPNQGGEWLGYPGSLSQVLLNLLSNAQRYAYPGAASGRVEIALSEEPDGRYRIAVRDFGAGIPPEALPRVFEPFFTTGRGRGGSGLGMSIVHNIVTAHLGGEIAIDSTPGQGTQVTLTLPAKVPESPKDHTQGED